MQYNPEEVKRAIQELKSVTRYEKEPFRMPKPVIRLSLTVLGVGFLILGLAMSGNLPSILASLLVASVFTLFAVIL